MKNRISHEMVDINSKNNLKFQIINIRTLVVSVIMLSLTVKDKKSCSNVSVFIENCKPTYFTNSP